MRKKRLLQHGAVYHVSARINNKEMLLESDQMKKLFEKILIRAKHKFDFCIENFVIMGNHYHLIIRPIKEESLSHIMQWIMSVFAMAVNKKLGRSGHVWGERFYSRILYTLREYIAVSQYIDENPHTAGLIERNTVWRHSGMYHYKKRITMIVEMEKPEFLKWIWFNEKNPVLMLT